MRMNKIGVIAAAICAILLIGSLGAYAYWTANAKVENNKIASGHMAIELTQGAGVLATPIDVSGLMPGQTGFKEYIVTSSAGNPVSDLIFKVDEVTGEGTLKDNLKIAVLLTSSPNYYYWLTPTGPIQESNAGPAFVDDPGYYNAYFNAAEYSAKSFTGMADYTALGPLAERHVKIYWYLPSDCSEDCHDSDVNFGMTFGLIANH